MKRRISVVVCFCVLSMAGSVQAVRAPGAAYVSFERLIGNMEAYVKNNPSDPYGYYVLGRMHYFAFVDRLPYVPVRCVDCYFPPKIAADWLTGHDKLLWALRYDQAEELVLKEWGYAASAEVPSKRRVEFQEAVSAKEQELEQQGWTPSYFDTATALTHAATAVDNFERALDLDPENGLYYLGLASLYQQYGLCATDPNAGSPPRQLADITMPKTRLLYYLAYRFSIDEDRVGDRPMWDLRGLVSYEAGTNYLVLVEKEPTIADTNAIAAIKADLAQLEKLGISITPIIFSTQEHASVLNLLDPNTHTTFDLDGTGRNAQWPWIKPTTGLLVWDPQNKGEITSGRQLFGTATWWLLFPNGYAALDALDDNRDGSLSGSELKGIGVWFDKNANGRSDPGEVQQMTNFGVQAIRTKSTGTDHGMLMNAQGLVLKNGTVVPTYDWVVSPIARNQEQGR